MSRAKNPKYESMSLEELKANMEKSRKQLEHAIHNKNLLEQRKKLVERKERSHRLIVKGAEFEKAFPLSKDLEQEDVQKVMSQLKISGYNRGVVRNVSNAAEKTVSQASRNLDIGKIISEFLTERNGNLQVFDGSGNIGLMNTRTEQVWIDAERKLPGIDAGVNFTYATMQMAQTVKGIQGVDLRSWLWNVLWHSSEIVKDVDYKAYYQLKSWPQPNNKLDRQAIFRIAACFEKGASVAQVEQKSKVPADVIRRFVKIAVLMQMLVETEEKQARLITEEKPAEGLLKGFFGKLRKKLGL